MEDPNNPGYDESGDPLVQGVVEATSAMAGSGLIGKKSDLARCVEAAMAKAIEDACLEDPPVTGTSDPDGLRERMLAARKSVLDEAHGRTPVVEPDAE